MAPIRDPGQPTPELPAPRPQDSAGGGPHWVDGEFTIRLCEPGADRVVRVRRPFALLGRIAGSDVRIEDRAVSGRHVYLHLDRRGVFGVDLATRTGTRFGPAGHSSGWLRPGDWFEVAGRRVELVELRVEGREPGPDPRAWPDPAAADPLSDAGGIPLVAVTLHAIHARHVPRALGSELVFVGRGPSCGVRVEGATASRVHCVLVRTTTAAFIVDLIGRGTWLNGRLVAGATPLTDGDTLAIGSAQFGVRIAPHLEAMPALRSGSLTPELVPPPGWPATFVENPVQPFPGGAPGLPANLPPELLAWMMGALQAGMGALQAGQAEALRQQGEFHLALISSIQQMQRDSATLLTEHLNRMERIDKELAALRVEIYRRFGSAEAATATAAALPREVPSHLRIAPVPKPPDTDAAATASWLIDRVSQLEEEKRSTLKDMVTRLTGRPR